MYSYKVVLISLGLAQTTTPERDHSMKVRQFVLLACRRIIIKFCLVHVFDYSPVNCTHNVDCTCTLCATGEDGPQMKKPSIDSPIAAIPILPQPGIISHIGIADPQAIARAAIAK